MRMILYMFLKIPDELVDIGVLKFILGIASVIIALLLTAVGYFIKQRYSDEKKEREEEREKISKEINSLSKKQKESVDKLSSVVETVSDTVNNLKIIVEVIKEQQKDEHPRTERRLNQHSKEIQALHSRVVKLESHCHINHGSNNL